MVGGIAEERGGVGEAARGPHAVLVYLHLPLLVVRNLVQWRDYARGCLSTFEQRIHVVS